MSNREPGVERPYRIDAEWSRAVFARRTGAVAEFLLPHLRAGMRLIDCGCGPGSITADLAGAVAPGDVIGIDIREDALADARRLARDRGISNVTFQMANIYDLPVPDASFDAAFACAVLQHLATPLAALAEMRRVLKPGGVIGIVDGSSPLTFRYPTSPLLRLWDDLRVRARDHHTGNQWDPLRLRAALREAGFARVEASGGCRARQGRRRERPTRRAESLEIT
jgi:ubiquinone/menaquinone biosynthesis C-methylase UbiE